MPVHIETNWRSSLFVGVDGGKPFEIKDVVCNFEEPDEAPEELMLPIDLTKTMTFTMDMQQSSTSYKNIMRLIGRGNNWRRMHGLKPIRVPMKERRRRTDIYVV